GARRPPGARMKIVPGGTPRVDEHGADRVGSERARHELPARVARVLGHVASPDAAAGSREVDLAGAVLLAARERKRRHAPGGGVLLAAGEELVEDGRVLGLPRS